MSGAVPRKTKKKKQAKAEPVKKKEPEIVTCKLADNDYTGIIREGQLGSQYLDCASAKYTWHSGIKYDGPFNMSQIEGKGKFEWNDGSTYTGELHGGKRHGQGLYVSKDGVTQYEGQWCMGKRHGEGKLSYTADGISFYEGTWKEGKKHGEGKQVWPSLNTYAGQWEDGQMRGQGTMTWYNQGQVETYSGNWEDSQPHGEGTHTWLAPEPKPDQAFKDTTAQQLNNRYKGQWQKGTRHGRGSFYYANGAYYTGEWQDHVKQGKGRHVFEDGRVYDGPFEADSMTEYKAADPVGLNFGNDDNPVRRMIDICDIQMFACPYDCRGLDGNAAHQLYCEPSKILREVYNMLLRSLGDLKELYYRYRVLLPVTGEDPFVLSSHQFWLFARDCGLISPTCMVHRLDRSIFCGPRHHMEMAPDDTEEIRPLTPRPADLRRSSTLVHVNPADGGDEDGEDEHDDEDGTEDRNSTLDGTYDGSIDDGSPIGGDRQRGSFEGGSMPPIDVATLPIEDLATACPCGNAFVDESLFCNKCGAKRLPKETEHVQENAHCMLPRVPRYRRHEDQVSNIHNPTGQLLFRQFVEGAVRLSLALFPCEKSLEVQAHRLFKEKVGPHLESLRLSENQPSSMKCFDFISDPDFRKVLDEFRPRLLVLFRGGVVNAEYNEDNWINAPKDAGGKHIVRIRHYGDFGAPVHSYHVCARLDKTIRIKDAFRLLTSSGLMRGLKRGDVPWGDLAKQVYAYAADEDLLDIDEKEKEALIAAQESGSTTPSESDLGGRALSGIGGQSGGGMGGFGGFGGQSSGMGGFGGLGGGMGEENNKRRKNDDPSESRSRRRKKDADDDEKGSKDDEPTESKPTVATPTVATLADFASCDFSVTPLQALRLILEVASPGSVKALYWHLDPARVSINHETIGILEFMETELIFTEFVRLLIRMSDLGTRKDIPLCERLIPAARFEGFIRHIFWPALKTAYVAPSPATDEAEKASDAARSNEAADVPLASAREGAEAKSGEGSNAGEEAPEEPAKDEMLEPVIQWNGFDDYTSAEVEEHHAARRWPPGYEQEIANWV